MKVIIDDTTNGTEVSVEMPSVPRVGEDIEVNDNGSATIVAVIWTIDEGEYVGVTVRVR